MSRDGGTMMDKIKNLFIQYYDLTMEWYSGLDPLAQYAVIVVLFIVGFGAAAMFILSKVTK